MQLETYNTQVFLELYCGVALRYSIGALTATILNIARNILALF